MKLDSAFVRIAKLIYWGVLYVVCSSDDMTDVLLVYTIVDVFCDMKGVPHRHFYVRSTCKRKRKRIRGKLSAPTRNVFDVKRRTTERLHAVVVHQSTGNAVLFGIVKCSILSICQRIVESLRSSSLSSLEIK